MGHHLHLMGHKKFYPFLYYYSLIFVGGCCCCCCCEISGWWVIVLYNQIGNIPLLCKGCILFRKLKVLHVNLCNQLEFCLAKSGTSSFLMVSPLWSHMASAGIELSSSGSSTPNSKPQILNNSHCSYLWRKLSYQFQFQ